MIFISDIRIEKEKKRKKGKKKKSKRKKDHCHFKLGALIIQRNYVEYIKYNYLDLDLLICSQKSFLCCAPSLQNGLG
ncbi:hypothetical protein EYC84_003581 [Monilinia fructicola]|uniref:Uncharacterized protein n=1 Tax=Monilinia fructicola TaxID=38448 RepID=A0A5M9JX41_MONFR|nr:hypothetical protein EYC84_003581 [Monilinia fructicola]